MRGGGSVSLSVSVSVSLVRLAACSHESNYNGRHEYSRE